MILGRICPLRLNVPFSLLISLLIVISVPEARCKAKGCPNGYKKFEIITGYAYTSSSDLLTTIPGCVHLDECLSQCRQNDGCKSVNFETGLCVLLNSSAIEKPEALQEAQFPVFTIYAQKVCMSDYGKCNHASWAYERVIGYELRSVPKKTVKAFTPERCMESCLREESFECRAANFERDSRECSLYDIDRHTVVGFYLSDLYSGLQAHEGKDFMESNCVAGGLKLCEYKKLPTLVLKTVDAVYEDVDSIKECRKKCLEAPFRCHSFDLGDGITKVCRISHLDRSSLTHVQEPYTEIPGATTYEMDICFNVTLQCEKKEMVAKFKATRAFTGKVYAATRPNSCFQGVKNGFEFQLVMPYNDYECGVISVGNGRFSNNVIIQKHNLIVTSSDLDLTFNCEFNLSNKLVTNQIQLQSLGDHFSEFINDETNVEFEIYDHEKVPPKVKDQIKEKEKEREKEKDKNKEKEKEREKYKEKDKEREKFKPDLAKPTKEPPTHEATFHSPTVSMRITDRNGDNVRAAEVGDPLSLRFEIADRTSPYEIFVRDIIADDGVDTSELMLIDQKGCPTDVTIMGPVKKVLGDGKLIEAPFDAFKFPTSGIVQFRALIVPCLESCDPAYCMVDTYDGNRQKTHSYGRRKRSSDQQLNETFFYNEFLAVESIEIFDKFPPKEGLKQPLDDNGGTCIDIKSVVYSCVSFLMVQFILISCWGFVYYRRCWTHVDLDTCSVQSHLIH